MGFLRSTDAISAKEARAYATIDGRVIDMFYAKNLEGTIDKDKVEFKALGTRATQHRAIGWSGSGSMTIYYVTSEFRKMVLQYVKTGRDVYFDIQCINDDPASTIGKQTTVLKRVNLDGVTMASFDVDGEILEEDIEFTFEDADLLDEFGMPVLA